MCCSSLGSHIGLWQQLIVDCVAACGKRHYGANVLKLRQSVSGGQDVENS